MRTGLVSFAPGLPPGKSGQAGRWTHTPTLAQSSAMSTDSQGQPHSQHHQLSPAPDVAQHATSPWRDLKRLRRLLILRSAGEVEPEA